jgi:hypothetical protein
MVRLLFRVQNPAHEKDSFRLGIEEQEQERMVDGYILYLGRGRHANHDDTGGSRCFRAVFVNIHISFVQDIPDKQVFRSIHTGEICILIKGIRHTQRGQGAFQIEPRFNFKFGHGQIQRLARQPGQNVCELYIGQPGLEIGKTAGGRHQDYHHDVAACIGQTDRLVVAALGVQVGDIALGMHHWYTGLAAIQQGKGLISGTGWIKGTFPGGFEVDCVGQDQTGGVVDGTLWKQVRDLTLGLLLDLGVDHLPGWFRGMHEVCQVHPGSIVLGQQIQVGRQEREAILAPDGVGNIEPEARVVIIICRSIGSNLLIQGIHSRMQALLGQAEVQRLRHLLLRIAPGAGIGHCQGQRDAVG